MNQEIQPTYGEERPSIGRAVREQPVGIVVLGLLVGAAAGLFLSFAGVRRVVLVWRTVRRII